MRNIALFLTYLGTNYHGWQVQKNLPTVAETMEKAAAMIVGHPVHMTGCGRDGCGGSCTMLCGKLSDFLHNSGGSASLCAEYPSAL